MSVKRRIFGLFRMKFMKNLFTRDKSMFQLHSYLKMQNNERLLLMVFQNRHSMTGWRIGYVAGDAKL